MEAGDSSLLPAPQRLDAPLTSHYLLDLASLLPPLVLAPCPGDRVRLWTACVVYATGIMC